MAKRKLYGLCKTCKDRIECYKPFRVEWIPFEIEKSSCDAKNNEIHQKFFNWTDKYGNIEMFKIDLTKEEKIELHDWLNKIKDFSGGTCGGAFEKYNQIISNSHYRHDKSEYIFKKTGVRTPTPNDFTIDEQNDWYKEQYTKTGVCEECVIKMCCHEICDAKIEEGRGELDNEEKNNGLCKKCVIRDSCRNYSNCIERKKEIKKIKS